jgi:hypothetical protein
VVKSEVIENVFQLESTKEKSKDTNYRKYGADFYTKTDEYREKVKETNNKKVIIS